MFYTVSEILRNQNVKHFFYYVLICCLLGTLIQWISLPSIDHDELEAVRWGAAKSWFVDKHPPLVGVVSFWWAKATGFSNLGFFLFSKINAIIAIYIIYALNRQFLSIHLSLISTAAYASTYAYITLMSQLDANGILHALWPLVCLLVWKSLNDNSLSSWILLGAVSALAVLGKYQSVLLLITTFLFILSSKNFRPALIKFKFLISLLIFLITLMPHFHSYYYSDYSVVDYVLSRGESEAKGLSGRLSILTFILTQILTGLFGYLILIFTLRKNLKYKVFRKSFKFNDDKFYFLLFFGIILPLSPVIMSLLTGITLLGSWGLVSWFLFPSFLLYAFKAENLLMTIKPYQYFVPVYILIMVAVTLLNNFYEIARPTQIPIAMEKIEKQWFKKISEKPHTVITNSRPAQGMTFYSNSKPQVIFGENPEYFSWILNEDGCTKGATLIITDASKIGLKFLAKQIAIAGKPTFEKSISIMPKRFNITISSGLTFYLAGYSDPICLG